MGDGDLVDVPVPPQVGQQGALSLGSLSWWGQWAVGPVQCRGVLRGKHSSLVMNIMSTETNGPASYSVYVK